MVITKCHFLHFPSLVQRGNSAQGIYCTRHINKAMVKAIARAQNTGERAHATIAEIAAAEKINETYVGRVLRLMLLAPDIVEAIVNGRQPAEFTLAGLKPILCPGTSKERCSFAGARQSQTNH